MSTPSERNYTGEWLKWLCSNAFCLDVLTLKAATTQTIKSGSPLRDNTGYILVANGQEAHATAIALEAISATGGEKILCLVRGPAVVDSSKMSFETSVSWAEIADALAALDIRPYKTPNATWTTQTT